MKNLFLLLCLVVIGSLYSGALIGQDTYEPGDLVEIKQSNEWVEGEIVERFGSKSFNRYRVLFFDSRFGRDMVHVFGADDIRLKVELPKETRVWTSSNGKHKFEARILTLSKTSITLEDSNQESVDVPLDQLSKADLEYIAKLTTGTESDNPFAKKKRRKKSTRTPNSVELSVSGTSSFELTAQKFERIDVVDKPAAGEFESATFRCNTSLIHEANVLFSEDWTKCLIWTHYPFRRPNKEPETQVGLVDMKTGQTLNSTELPISNAKISEFSPAGNQFITHSRTPTRRLDVWRFDDQGELQHRIGWTLESGQHGHLLGTYFIDEDLICVVSRAGRVDTVNLEKKSVEFRHEFGTGMNSCQLRNREWLLLFGLRGTKAVNLTEATVADMDAKLSYIKDVSASGKSFGANGSTAYLWDADGKKLDEFVIPNLNSGGRASWVNERYLTLTHHTSCEVIDTLYRIRIARFLGGGNLSIDRAGRLWSIRKSGNELQLNAFDNSMLAFPAELPNDPDALLISETGKGVQINDELNALRPADREKVREHFESQFTNMGLEIVDDSNLVLSISALKGKPYEKEYRDFMGFGGRLTETVTVKPIKYQLSLTLNDKSLLDRKMESSLNFVLHLERGETIQKAINRLTKPSSSFFLNFGIPRHLAIHPPEGAYVEYKVGDSISAPKVNWQPTGAGF